MLRYDGLYISYYEDEEDRGVYTSCLRFYRNGTVICCVTCGEVEEIIKWFDKSNPNIRPGKYKVYGDRIEFSVKYEFNFECSCLENGKEKRWMEFDLTKINYKGSIVKDTLELQIHSYRYRENHKPIDKYFLEKYTFVETADTFVTN
ncbi:MULTISPECIES: hypothetical protein [Nostocales]|uniref:Uncharacterized protein n=3 Tax=Nostocales TaxID=1161 RepID=A0A0C1RIX9_9CYAN|nr:hypothetical protein [Tolypothrix bouteillei]KAF3884121.1 hypothetical protein DA73_0400000365 [Tolypothrix bouteillei VB521301]